MGGTGVGKRPGMSHSALSRCVMMGEKLAEEMKVKLLL